MLHLVNALLDPDDLARLCRWLDRESKILLIEDGVYAAAHSHPHATQFAEKQASALRRDSLQRSIPRIHPAIMLIDDNDFVAYVVQCGGVMNWGTRSAGHNKDYKG